MKGLTRKHRKGKKGRQMYCNERKEKDMKRGGKREGNNVNEKGMRRSMRRNVEEEKWECKERKEMKSSDKKCK